MVAEENKTWEIPTSIQDAKKYIVFSIYDYPNATVYL